MSTRSLLPLLLLAIAAGTNVNLYGATTHATVGLCSGSGIHYTTISQAVTAVSSSPGAVIGVCPGTYPEQVMISSSLTLQGITSGNQDAVIIAPPAGGLVANASDPRGSVAAQVLVQGTTGVTITNLTVDGKGNQDTSDDVRGILYQDASGTVNHVAVRNEVPGDVASGAQSGQGIFVETNTGSAALTVQNCAVHNYNKNGIVARYTNATLTATNNYVTGNGVVPSPGAAQNGIEIAFGASGTIKANTVIDNVYGDASAATSSDILLYDAFPNSSIVISGNTVGNSNIPIGFYAATQNFGDSVTVTLNKIQGPATIDAIDVCTNDNTITNNTIFDSLQSGIHLDGTCTGGTGNHNSVTGNTILESQCAGILDDTGNNTATSPNTYYTVPFKVTSSCAAASRPARTGGRGKVNP